MAGKLQPGEICAARSRRPAVGHQHRRVLVLEAAARFRDHVEEDVAVVRQQSPQPAIFLDDRFEVFRRAGAVEHATLADIDQ